MANEDVHLSKCPLIFPKIEAAPSLRRFSPSLRRFSISGLIHGIAIETSDGEGLAVAKERLFRAAVSMSEERNGMRAGSCGEKSKRRCVCGQHYFLDADARLDHARDHGPKNQGDDGRCNYPTVSSSIHSISLVMSFLQSVTLDR